MSLLRRLFHERAQCPACARWFASIFDAMGCRHEQRDADVESAFQNQGEMRQ